MFEKEAEEYTLNKLVGLEDFDNYQSAYDRYENGVQDAFKDGAEFGYKEGFKDCAKSRLNVTTISDCPIKDEWHYVKDGLPKESGKYLVYVGGVNGVFVLDFETEYNDFGYWCLQFGENLGVSDTVFETITERNEDKVIAWKEIVLPELKERE